MNKALIVIDVQKFFLTNKTRGIVKQIQEYLNKNSSDYEVVYFTIFKNNSSAPLWQLSEWKDCAASPDTDICDEIKQFTSLKNLFYKNLLSAAKVPQIREGLHEHKISEVDLCGFDTDCCVLATAYDLFDQGIKPVVLENLTWSTSKEKLHAPALKMLLRNIGFVRKV
jgi:nicotinamidase-related amidase